ncbi:MAG: biotin--[Lachnospiraceae bacterium]|nr:biotin--[acetyl-CoA-carboxylase] ligase [Lachnospiraceae bacterium]
MYVKMISMETKTDALSEKMMKSLLRTERIGSRLFCLSQVDSTNEELKRRFITDEDLPEGTVAITSDQVAGKGRRGRGWVTPPGVNIAMSIFLRPKIDPSAASMLTIVAALAVCRTCMDMTGLSCRIKWPNDVVVEGKKVCGILTEMSVKTLNSTIEYVIVGIGVNVNTLSFPPELSDKATSLKIACGHGFDLNEPAVGILTHFEKLYDEFLKCEDLGFMTEEYNTLLVSREKAVRVLDPKGEYEGVSLGINDKGELLVRTGDGSIRNVYAGEVSVRGIYGYV